MKTKLERIGSPEDLKNMGHDELTQLCREIRSMLISISHENGGHLASNLGVVELTVALHRVFNSPNDRIIWDVGHQCYTHKILTGRKEAFGTIRRHRGLSGFPDPFESEHDPVFSGHAGTSVSSAAGIAAAIKLKESADRVIAVIGDGSLGAGIALEAINHAGHAGTGITIILNDNGMSISPTVGSICRALQKIRCNRRYISVKNRIHEKTSGLPFGRSFLEMGAIMKRMFRNTIMPGTLWEELGLLYMGPVDGHNIAELEEILARRRDSHSGPAIIHVVTKKGKGYRPAEANAVHFHGIAPSCKKDAPQEECTFSGIFAESLMDLMERNEKIVAVTAAMTDGTGLAPVARKFPDRVFDVGICEQHAVTMAAGIATQGFIPVVAIYSTFLQRAYDQIIHDVCIQGLPVIFAIDRAGVVGDDGKTHQGIFDISFLRTAPGLTLCAPMDGAELRDMLGTAVAARRPFAIRYPRGNTAARSKKNGCMLRPGKGEILREGPDCAILAVGSMVGPSLAAAEQLANAGIDCTVANMRYIKPLDGDLILEAAASTGTIVTVEENVVSGGFGSAVLEFLNREGMRGIAVKTVALQDDFIEHGPQTLMREKSGLDAAGIARQIWSLYSDIHREKTKQRAGAWR